MIKMINIKKYYNQGKINEKAALKDVNLNIEDGELVAVMGKSGAGKTTLMKILGCLDKYSDGEYLLNGFKTAGLNDNQLSKLRNKELGIITQDSFLIDDLSVLDNVGIPLMLTRTKKDLRKMNAVSMLQSIGIKDLVNQKVSTLSGGEKQRVAIARALVNNPEIILADEPTGSLDSANADKIIDILLEINKHGKTVIIITHDIDIAKKCNRIITLHDGKIISDEAVTRV